MKILYSVLFLSLSLNVFLLVPKRSGVEEAVPQPISLSELKEKLDPHCQVKDAPLGSICAFAGEVDKDYGWIPLEGQKITQKDFPELFKLLKSAKSPLCEEESCQLMDSSSPFECQRKGPKRPPLVVYGVKSK